METPLVFLGCEFDNRIYLKRDDLYPFSFGGSKARIACRYFDEIDAGGFDCVVTYGSPRSNLCRAVAVMAAQRELPCVAVVNETGEPDSFNARLARLSGAQTVFCPVDRVGSTIEETQERLRRAGRRPYFIPGGGQGLPGVQAYAECYDEILAYERREGIAFDYLFLPSGTGTTQSGLVCGKLLRGGSGVIVGISVARTAEQGRSVILKNVRDYCAAAGAALPDAAIERAVIFEDGYTGGGYGKGDYAGTAAYVWRKYAVPLDNTYTGKAFYGMGEYLRSRGIAGKTALFLHTGGAPLFFDDLLRERQ